MYAVFSDYCDPYIMFFETEEEALEHFNKRNEESSGIENYLCKIIQSEKMQKAE